MLYCVVVVVVLIYWKTGEALTNLLLLTKQELKVFKSKCCYYYWLCCNNTGGPGHCLPTIRIKTYVCVCVYSTHRAPQLYIRVFRTILLKCSAAKKLLFPLVRNYFLLEAQRQSEEGSSEGSGLSVWLTVWWWFPGVSNKKQKSKHSVL